MCRVYDMYMGTGSRLNHRHQTLEGFCLHQRNLNCTPALLDPPPAASSKTFSAFANVEAYMVF